MNGYFLAIFVGLVFCLFIYEFVVNSSFKNDYPQLNHEAFKQCEIPDLSFHPYSSDDLGVCLEIYRELEDLGQLPKGHIEEYQSYLEECIPGLKLFIIKSKGKVIATCGLRDTEFTYHLVYGLVKPEFQRKGLGSLMLAARLLEVDSFNKSVGLSPIDSSVNYYSKYGFELCYIYKEEILLKDDPKVEKDNEEFIKLMLVSLHQGDHDFLRNYFSNAVVDVHQMSRAKESSLAISAL